MQHDASVDTLSWWSCQSAVAHNWGLLNHPNSFCRGMFKLNVKLMQIHYSTCSLTLNVSATQYTCSPNGIYCTPLTSTVKSSLFTHAHSSPLSLAARLHWCCANCSYYINNGWTLSRQTSYIQIYVYVCIYFKNMDFGIRQTLNMSPLDPTR